MEVVLGMFFLTFNNVDVQFAEKKLTWKIYITKEALPTTRWVKIINQKGFIKAALDENIKAFVVHVSSLGLRINIHPARKAQLALLLAKKVTVPAKCLDFTDVFSEELANILPERTGANGHAIELEVGKKLPYGPIYNLGPVELKTLKTYIKTNLAKGFIRVSKSPVEAPIVFVHKPDRSFCLCVNYREFNNLTIKNWYLLPLIGKSLDRLGWAKQFT